jgi:dihydrofolate reductase
VSGAGVVGGPDEWLAMTDELEASVAARAASADTILLGRATYEEFAAEWRHRSGALADFINGTPKLVVSTSLDTVWWESASLIDGNATIGAELARLRRAPGKDIVVLGSATLVQSLLRRKMVDELMLLIQPEIKGPGRRLFDELTDGAPLEQVGCVTFETGFVSLSYEMSFRPDRGPNDQMRRPRMRPPEEPTMYITPDPAIRELDRRINDGIDVKLLWNSDTNRVSVAVEDERTGEFFELDVDPEDALIAFQHPYAYASRGWIDGALAA